MVRVPLLMGLYTFSLLGSFWLSYLIRFDFNIELQYKPAMMLGFAWIIPLKLLVLILLGQFSGWPGYFSIPDLRGHFTALAASSFIIYVVRFATGTAFAPPRGIILLDFLLSFMMLTAMRLALRIIREKYFSPQNAPARQAKRIGIIGAGDVGASLAKELDVRRGLGLEPAAFFDDNKDKWGSRVYNIPVVGPPEYILQRKDSLHLEQLVIAMPSAPVKRIREVLKILQQAHLPYYTVPSPDQLATGKVKVSRLRSVEIQDLLNREPVQLDSETIGKILKDRPVMVTGAGGSIGSELCRQIAAFNPKRLLLVEQCEVQIFKIEQELIGLGYGGTIVPLVADLLDLTRMRIIFERYRPEVIFHAAAHKHVPMMEMQPTEAIKNNTLGTFHLARLAQEFNADRLVMISTDKAINPTSVMGVSKRLAEIAVQALYAGQPEKTKFMAVRFGNVLGSSGSVVPIFENQIAAGGPVKVTHPEVTRYFMTIPEAVGLVLQSGAQGVGGEIFILDMGNPVKIVDLARQLIELHSLKPDVDIEIEFVGLRPGEKLFEELSHRAENIQPTNHPKILRLVATPPSLASVVQELNALSDQMHSLEPNQLKQRIKQIVPEYQPFIP